MGAGVVMTSGVVKPIGVIGPVGVVRPVVVVRPDAVVVVSGVDSAKTRVRGTTMGVGGMPLISVTAAMLLPVNWSPLKVAVVPALLVRLTGCVAIVGSLTTVRLATLLVIAP